MKYLDEYRDSTLAKTLVGELQRAVTKPLRIMEVCGSHTMAIFRNGIRTILPEGLELISGPGCPVCVTSASHMDAFIAMADKPGVRVAIFGDLFRVPGSNGSLANASSRGAKVDIVYSPMDALELAKHIRRIWWSFSASVLKPPPRHRRHHPRRKKPEYQQFCRLFDPEDRCPPPLTALLEDPALQIDGLLCPGHVSAIIGAGAYVPLAEKYDLACVVAGFETADLLNGLILLARQIGNGEAKVENAYGRVVCWEGNRQGDEDGR